MDALEDLKRSIHVTSEMQSLVKTMKVLAGLNIRQYERAAHSVAAYNRTIEMGLQVALRRLTEPFLQARGSGNNLGVIVFGSDQGLCGKLNDVIVSHALRALRSLERRRTARVIIAVGQRAAGQLSASGKTVDATLEVPGSTIGITATVHELLERIEEERTRHGIEMFVLFYCKLVSGVFYRPSGVRILPVDAAWIRSLKTKPWHSRVIPAFTLEPERLFHSLIREYLFGSLYGAAAESLASENAARLASMQVAERNIEDRLKALTSEFHQSRQAAVTSELLDIVSASEALAAKDGRITKSADHDASVAA
jgi:F-type H+-transporting ATPase subunit gamma